MGEGRVRVRVRVRVKGRESHDIVEGCGRIHLKRSGPNHYGTCMG